MYMKWEPLAAFEGPVLPDGVFVARVQSKLSMLAVFDHNLQSADCMFSKPQVPGAAGGGGAGVVGGGAFSNVEVKVSVRR